MYKVNPTGEMFFLRLLLLQAKGATSWEDVRTVNGIVLETFREACVLKGLWQDDTEWQNTLSAIQCQHICQSNLDSCFQLF